MKNRSRRRAGFTMSELLVATLLLSMLTLGMVVGINAAINTQRRAQALAECSTLSSTLLQAIQDELRYAQNVNVNGDHSTVTFTNAEFGADATMSVDSDGHVVISAGGGIYDLISEAAYTGQKIDSLRFTKNDSVITVDLTIHNDFLPEVTGEGGDPSANPNTVYSLAIRCVNAAAA